MSIAKSITVNESAGITFLEVDNAYATGKISLYGGHVLSFIPKSDQKERLWLSPHAYLNGERPIRGGIPICWPWFSDDHGKEKGTLPSHGFLRSQVWQLQQSEDLDDATRILLTPSFSRGDGFEYDCQVTLELLVGATLEVTLHTKNTGVIPFVFNTALHTYFEVPDIGNTSLTGIHGNYKDKTDNWAVKATPMPYTISGETDRIHLTAIPEVIINDSDTPLTSVSSSGHDSVVVWNPWQGAASISDMDAFGFKHMLCVETAFTQGCEVAPGDTHSITQIISPA
ncbi:D-hexose-6-phosphate mutarotase [Alteromonas pelagimontana]|uniref:Putative glucose-6-phosphate 1-epimerase n=1 Tax=Alteromonas pelagimontana TaxID=1858656 RepID=A0A6M4MHG5_9ALTE|nr:D-hexose-6-phosphate mutarotase [Alteromonas pelagimontana]QJR82437.1 D-hexose-6-phosphate mutarotase [Alteromonas pelagimontana]